MNNIRMKKLVLVFMWLVLVVPVYGEGPVVELETNFGNVVIELYDADAPVTVENFLTYVKSGFYDGLIFHRVIDNFMIQGGGFDTSLNRPAVLDPIINESNNGLSNLRGTIAMARTDDPNSATSQFYINVVDNNFLDYNDITDVGYCVFGRVISDMNIVDRIGHLPTENGVAVPAGGTMNNVPRPPGPVIIYNAKILGDFDKDSDVDFRDYGIFANQWLDSGCSDPFKITDGNANDWFGYSVAVDANHAIIGAPGDGGNIGAAYIFERNDGIWTQKTKLTAFDGGEVGDYFGISVSISANYAIVGAVGDDDYMGAAYLFKNNGGNWTVYAKLLPYDDDIDDRFGQSVAISGDCAVVGAWLNDAAGVNTGSAYVFYRNQDGTDQWGQQARLEAADAVNQDRFGYSVAINGEYIIVGAIGDDLFKGSAYIFRYKNSAWTQQAKLTADDGYQSDKFGTSVSTDGYYAIVGARLNDEKGEDTGAAYIFAPNALDPNNWDQKTKLTASDAAANDYFGCSVAIGDGHALVGSYGNDDSGSNTGSAYIFEPNEINPDNWVQSAKLTASDANAGDYFGFSVALGMGRQTIIGAYGNDDNGSNSGSAYILKLCPDADLDGDCIVTLYDLAILTDNWLLH
ncbi:MAG: peptidylprolyl isomerase [Phycisphaerae bacterium]|nr:peptidylprolyl isomerase [Phycisphaerae bacterium]MDD5380653.1 peptidylprolyl isomerase [Phycisphaerae bacterium]